MTGELVTMIRSANKRIKILVADEPAEWVRRFDSVFAFKPVEFIVTGKDFGKLDILSENNPDIAMIAGDIPGFDGLEAARRIRRFGENMPVIMVGGGKTRHWFEQALLLGVKAVIPRPVDISQLVEITVKYLKK